MPPFAGWRFSQRFERDTMKRWMIWVVCVFAAATVLADGEASAPEEEFTLDKAREKLDEAANRFAEVITDIDWLSPAEDWPFLGIVVSTDDLAGIRVESVISGGPAEKAGIRADDLIVHADSFPITGSISPTTALHNALHGRKPGEAVKLRVLRAGDSLTFDVLPEQDARRHWDELGYHGVLPPVLFQPSVRPGQDDPRHRERTFGFKLIDIEETLGAYFGVEKGVLVLTAEDDSKFLPGDIVRRVGGRDVTDADATYLALAEADAATQIVVRRNGKSKSLTIEPIQGVRVRKTLEFTR